MRHEPNGFASYVKGVTFQKSSENSVPSSQASIPNQKNRPSSISAQQQASRLQKQS